MVRLKCLKCINRSKHIQTNSGELNSIIKNWREFVFITNNMESSAEKIAWLYKNRWRVQLFFKWTKQHLRIFFLGVPQWMQSNASVLWDHNTLSGYHCHLQIESQPPFFTILYKYKNRLPNETFVIQALSHHNHKAPKG